MSLQRWPKSGKQGMTFITDKTLELIFVDKTHVQCVDGAPSPHCVYALLQQLRSRGSVSVPGARAGHLFFEHSPCLFLPPHQTICPQEARGDVATSDFVHFYWGPPRRQG